MPTMIATIAATYSTWFNRFWRSKNVIHHKGNVCEHDTECPRIRSWVWWDALKASRLHIFFNTESLVMAPGLHSLNGNALPPAQVASVWGKLVRDHKFILQFSLSSIWTSLSSVDLCLLNSDTLLMLDLMCGSLLCNGCFVSPTYRSDHTSLHWTVLLLLLFAAQAFG